MTLVTKRNELMETAYVSHYNVLYKKAYSRLKSVLDAEDAVHDAFELALKYYHSYNPKKAGLGAWVSTILTNVITDVQADVRGQGMVFEFKEELNEGHEMTHLGDELLEKMLGHIAERPDADVRAALTLYFVQGAKPGEIGRIIGSTSNKVWKIVHRFKQNMVEMYG